MSVAAAEAVVERHRKFRSAAALVLLAMMLVWPRKRRSGPPRLLHERWDLITLDFVLPACAARIAAGLR